MNHSSEPDVFKYVGSPPSILIATNHLYGWSGSETLFMTLLEGLVERGCKVTAYARHWDRGWIEGKFDHRIQFVGDLNDVRLQHYDLAHVQHSSCLIDVRAIFPSLPIVFSSLGVVPFLEQPPPFNVGISRYIAISEEVSDKLIDQGVPANKINIVRNIVCGKKFFPIIPIREKPKRILVLSNRIDDYKKSLIRQAARQISASIRFVGGGETKAISNDRLCEAINEVDVVVSLGRGVIETMLCGRVPLVFDIHGGDGLVTPNNLRELSKCNFSGRCYAKKYSVDDLARELGGYRQEYGQQLRDVALAHYSLEVNIERLMYLYTLAMSEKVDVSSPADMQLMLDFFSRMANEDVKLSNNFLSNLNQIIQSKSWRLTSPLRAIHNFTYKHIYRARRKT